MKKALIGSALTVSLLLAGAGQPVAATNQEEGLGRQSVDINTLVPTYLGNDNDISRYHPSTFKSQIEELNLKSMDRKAEIQMINQRLSEKSFESYELMNNAIKRTTQGALASIIRDI